MSKPRRKARQEAPPTTMPAFSPAAPTAPSHAAEPATGQPNLPEPPAESTLEFWINMAQKCILDAPPIHAPVELASVVGSTDFQAWLDVIAKSSSPRTMNQLQVFLIRRAAESFTEDKFQEQLEEAFSTTVFEQAEGRTPEFEYSGAYVGRILRTAWADTKLWQLVRSEADPHATSTGFSSYLSGQYWLHLPFPAAVWNEMSQQPKHRNLLFGLIAVRASRWCYPPINLPEGCLAATGLWPRDLSDQFLASLFRLYVEHPHDDSGRLVLAYNSLSKPTLKTLKAVAQQLAQDADWCLKHPGRRLAMPQAPHPPHRVMSLEKVQHLENMVALLKQDPSLTDYALAKSYFGGMPGRDDPTGSTQRGLASEARTLASLRDGLKLLKHQRRGA